MSKLVEALRELIAIQDLRERADKISPVEPGCEKEVVMDEWRKRSRHMWANARAALAEHDAQPATSPAQQQFDECWPGTDGDLIERLRFFCSLAMNGQDWLNVEPFFDALTQQAPNDFFNALTRHQDAMADQEGQ